MLCRTLWYLLQISTVFCMFTHRFGCFDNVSINQFFGCSWNGNISIKPPPEIKHNSSCKQVLTDRICERGIVQVQNNPQWIVILGLCWPNKMQVSVLLFGSFAHNSDIVDRCIIVLEEPSPSRCQWSAMMLRDSTTTLQCCRDQMLHHIISLIYNCNSGWS